MYPLTGQLGPLTLRRNTRPSWLDGLVSWWSLDEASGQAVDRIGVNSLANIGDCPPVTGILGGARMVGQGNGFSGSSNLPTAITTAFAVSTWLNGRGTTGTVTGIVAGSVSTAQRYWDIRLNGSTVLIDLSAGDGSAAIVYSLPAASNTWHHVLLSRDGALCRIWLDGLLVVDESTIMTAAPSSPTLRIGNTSATRALWVGPTAVWGRYLTEGEASDLWNGGAGRGYEG